MMQTSKLNPIIHASFIRYLSVCLSGLCSTHESTATWLKLSARSAFSDGLLASVTIRYELYRVQSYHVVTDALPAEPYHRVPVAFTVLAGCQQSAELPSLEMLDICKLNARGSNLMRNQVCITTDPVPITAFLPYQLRRASGLDGTNLNQRQHDSWVEHNPAVCLSVCRSVNRQMHSYLTYRINLSILYVKMEKIISFK